MNFTVAELTSYLQGLSRGLAFLALIPGPQRSALVTLEGALTVLLATPAELQGIVDAVNHGEALVQAVWSFFHKTEPQSAQQVHAMLLLPHGEATA